MTLEERYNRKRTPVVQRPELSTTPLVEPEVAGSQNPIAPTVDNTDETAPQASVVEPQMNDYQWNQRLYETLFQKPISQEEEERRKRAASVATGIGHLGNVLSSFSNLAFAGEAPSQKLPTVADPKLQSYSDRLEAVRQRYGAGYLAARQNDINNYQRALQLYRQDQARKAQNDLAKAKHSVVIAVPKVKFKYKPSIMSALVSLLHNGVSVVVHVKEEGANEIELSNAGMDVVCNKEQTLQCAVIDKAIVWYGNINFFGYNSETNNVMRIADHKIANEMMEILYSATENKVNGG